MTPAGCITQRSAPLPVSVWALKNGYGSGDKTSLFCVYRTHQEVSVTYQSSKSLEEGGDQFPRFYRAKSQLHSHSISHRTLVASFFFFLSFFIDLVETSFVYIPMADCFLRHSNISRRVKLFALQPSTTSSASSPLSTPTCNRLRNYNSFT